LVFGVSRRRRRARVEARGIGVMRVEHAFGQQPNTPPCYTLTVTGIGASATHSATVTLSVTASGSIDGGVDGGGGGGSDAGGGGAGNQAVAAAPPRPSAAATRCSPWASS
jgi:hypothetical protein